MSCVQVLNKSGKVLYTFESVGGTVSIGRDKKKCAIALPVDAQGVSRIHGSLTWDSQDKLTYSDASTYGTMVDGKLVKAASKDIVDGSHVLVGDVELMISFPQRPASVASHSEDDSQRTTMSLRGKRKSATPEPVLNNSKRSKLTIKTGMSQSRQSQKKQPIVEEVDDGDVILAEDTPPSRIVDPKAALADKSTSFVSDSLSVHSSSIPTQSATSSNASSTTTQSSSSVSRAAPRKKKQSIFAPNRKPYEKIISTRVLAEDTFMNPSRQIATTKETSNNVDVTCIADTCAENAPQSMSRKRELNMNTFSTLQDPSPQRSDTLQKSLQSETGKESEKGPLRNLNGSLPIKKARIYDISAEKTKTPLSNTSADVSDEADKLPDMYDILKLVSTGKHYDHLEGDAETVDEKGLEIDRVVAKLDDLVCYADIERPPTRNTTCTPGSTTSNHSSVNFKRFRKASQGRFNASLSSANLTCRIAGNEDLVDFRQLAR